jgi:hypothetical protein
MCEKDMFSKDEDGNVWTYILQQGFYPNEVKMSTT